MPWMFDDFSMFLVLTPNQSTQPIESDAKHEKYLTLANPSLLGPDWVLLGPFSFLPFQDGIKLTYVTF